MNQPFALVRDEVAFTWPVDPAWCSWNGLWGGAVLGLAVQALELESQRPVRALNAAFLSAVNVGDSLTIVPEMRVMRKEIAQAAVVVDAGHGRVLDGTAVLGLVPDSLITGQRPPLGPEPEDCPARSWMKPIPGGLQETLEARIAGTESHRVLLWTRCVGAGDVPMSAPLIAAAADYPAFSVTLATGGHYFGITLDTALRFFDPPHDCPGDSWLLLDNEFDGMAQNVAMARARVWLGDQLVATCEQTLRLRAKDAFKPVS